MSVNQLRLNPLVGRWVTVSDDRSNRPYAFAPRMLPVQAEERPCPFCPGNEEETPPALETYGPTGQWLVRIVPNLYPAFQGHEALTVENIGPVFVQAPASGIHEVLVLTPNHDASWADLDDRQAGLVMAALRDRFEEHASTPDVRYTQAIVNYGREAGASIEHPHGQLLGVPFVPKELAGASIEHPHGQLLGVPFVPKELAEEEAGFERFVGGCLMCTTVEAEVEAEHRVVYEDDLTVVVAPFWSGTPYELLVIPRSHEAHLTDAKPKDLVGVGRALQNVLARVRSLLDDVAYNLVFHAAPHRHEGQFHWHVHVIPKVTTRAGFELGTGVLINIVAPERAARELNEIS